MYSKKLNLTLIHLNKSENLTDINYIAIHIRELHGSGKSNINNSIDNLPLDYYKKCLKKIFNDKSISNIKNAIVFSDMWKNPESSKLVPKIRDF